LKEKFRKEENKDKNRTLTKYKQNHTKQNKLGVLELEQNIFKISWEEQKREGKKFSQTTFIHPIKNYTMD
jgi:flagellar motor component MotA